jgi:hypothetical protein
MREGLKCQAGLMSNSLSLRPGKTVHLPAGCSGPPASVFASIALIRPDTLLDLWAFGPDGVQVQLDGASIWPVAGDLQLAVIVVGSFRAPFDAPVFTIDPHPRLAGFRSPVDLRLYVDLVAAFRLGGRH